VVGVVERKQTMAVLSNVLIILKEQQLSITGSDSEIELVAKLSLDEVSVDGEITVPAKKLLDICKALPEDSTILFEQEELKMVVSSGRSKFRLMTLPASEFPNLQESTYDLRIEMNQGYFRRLLEATSFAMGQQDVRYYLNGMLLELDRNRIRAVATDGHRLALKDGEVINETTETRQYIVPRKGVLEALRLFNEEDESLVIEFCQSHIRLGTQQLQLTSKLIDGKFPDYERVIPRHGENKVLGDKDELKKAFARVSILSNEKYRGVRVSFDSDVLKAVANNPDQESAEELIPATYEGPSLEIGFNISYLLDVLGVIRGDTVRIMLSDSNGSALVSDDADDSALYVVMPMRM
jgi:DNA polymerase-3 subunit beta